MVNFKFSLLISAVLFLLVIQSVHSAVQVEILFLYSNPKDDPHWDPQCPPCVEEYELFLMKNATLTQIQQNYTGTVLVRWVHWSSVEGISARNNYNIAIPNSIVIRRIDGSNYKAIINFTWNVPKLLDIINSYINAELPPTSAPLSLTVVLAGAFSFGFFETFSPCLIILLSFVLSYSIGETTRFKESFLKVLTFGIGFIFATLLVFLGSVGLIIVSSMLAFQNALLVVICFFAIFFGFDLLGLNLSTFFKIKLETKPLIQKLSRKFVFTYAGLVVLGFLFYFLDPCIAPIFVIMVGTFQETLLAFLPLVLLVFCLGVLMPFIGIGFVAGSISKLARSAYRHKSKIRAVSGMLLVGYAFYLVSSYLMQDAITRLIIALFAVSFISILIALFQKSASRKNSLR